MIAMVERWQEIKEGGVTHSNWGHCSYVVSKATKTAFSS